MSDLEKGAALIQLLTGCLADTDITLLELRTTDETIRLVRDAAAPYSADTRNPAAAAAASPSLTVVSPAAGVFRHCHPLRPAPLAAPGQSVTTGDVVGLIQIGSLLMHVTSSTHGMVAELIAADGATVGYGTALLRLTRSGSA